MVGAVREVRAVMALVFKGVVRADQVEGRAAGALVFDGKVGRVAKVAVVAELLGVKLVPPVGASTVL